MTDETILEKIDFLRNEMDDALMLIFDLRLCGSRRRGHVMCFSRSFRNTCSIYNLTEKEAKKDKFEISWWS